MMGQAENAMQNVLEESRRRLIEQDKESAGTNNPEYRLYTFDKALRRTINRNYKQDPKIGCWKKYILIITLGAAFQVVAVTITVFQSSLACVSQTF